MPTVEKIEFERHLVSNTHGSTIVGVDTWTADTGIERPRIQGTVQSEDRSNVIVEDDVDVQSTSHTAIRKSQKGELQSASLEEIVVAFRNLCSICLFDGRGNLVFSRIWHGRLNHGLNGVLVGLGESPSFIDTCHLSDNVIVEPIETDEECAYAGGKSEDTSFRETIGFEETVFECANRVLIVLIGAVKWSKIEIRGSLIDVGIRLIGFEEISLEKVIMGGTMNDDSCKVEERAANLVWMFLVLFARKQG